MLLTASDPALRERVSPFLSLSYGDEPRKKLEASFLELFEISAAATIDAEEAWAYSSMQKLYAEATAGQVRRAPSFFEAMIWAAQHAAAAYTP